MRVCVSIVTVMSWVVNGRMSEVARRIGFFENFGDLGNMSRFSEKK